MEGWEGLQEAGCWPALEKVVYKNPAFPSQAPCLWDGANFLFGGVL